MSTDPPPDTAAADAPLPLLPEAGSGSGSVGDIRVSGEVSGIVFESADGSYAVVRVIDRSGRQWTLVGALAGLAEGQALEAWGRHEQHREYGSQIRVTRFNSVLPTTEEGIRRYLASGIVPGIGEKLAERIVDHFGGETLNILDNYSSRLREVPGFGKGRLATVREAWHEHADKRRMYVFLQGLGISAAYCNRIYRRFGEQAADVVAANPYALAAEVKGIGFKMADAVARRLDIAKDNPFRLASGILYVLRELAQQQGHTCFPRADLLVKAADVLEVEPAAAEKGLERLLADGAVLVSGEGCEPGGERIYARDLFRAERQLCRCIRALLDQLLPAVEPSLLPRSSRWAMLNDAQQQAVVTAFSRPVSIITGGPGVGKTTVTREIVAMARELQLRVSLAAPTGRAAKRLSEACKASAQTIHRLLKWEPEHGGFAYDGNRQLPTDLLIVDEVSMLDVELAACLFEAIPFAARVVLVGDRDQLPSVGPGAVLGDLIASRQVAATHLHEVYRQGDNSRIIVNAHRVNKGQMPQLHTDGGDGLRDFYWIEQDDPERVVEIICRLVGERIPRRFHFDPMRDVQVLSPMNRGACGAITLNQRLQERLNPQGDRRWQQFETANGTFRVGDRVMQVTNNYEFLVFNGDLGRIRQVENRNRRFAVQFDSNLVEYAQEDADQLRLAYAITIHKSQGCEFPAVIVPLLTQHYVMLRRNLVYTAMTRASRLLILVGSKRALGMAVRNMNQTPRYSRLDYFLSHDHE